MGRQPKQVCSVCGAKTTQAATKSDGAGGRRCKEECGSKAVDAADAANKAAAERVAAASPKTAARLASEAVARDTAHRKAVLDVLGARPATLSYRPAEIARMSGVPADEIDALVSAMHADGSLEEMSDELDEDPTYRAKPSPPAAPKPATNRKGKPVTVASEAARSCRVCGCTAEKPCDDGAGRPCGWTSSETPASGDLCFVCADAMALASELLDVPGAVPAEVAKRVEEDAAPCVDAARVAKILERLIAERTPTKKDRPRDTSKKRNTVTAPPAQMVLPGSEVARTATLPFSREPLAVVPEDRGTCGACGELLTRENSSRLQSGVVMHTDPSCGLVQNETPVHLSLPCAACDGERGEPCAWATPEPASYVHSQRVRLLPADEQRQIATRATQDRIRALCDYYAGLANGHSLPTEAMIVRAITSDGTDAGLVADVFGAMCERGELQAIDWPDGTYYRRAPGIALVVMGRVGVRASAVEEEAHAIIEDVVSRGAIVDPEVLSVAEEAEIIAAAPGQIGPGQTPIGPPAYRDPSEGEHLERFNEDGSEVPSLAARALSPAERMLVATSEIVRAAEEAREHARACLAAEVRERAAVEQLDAVQRERDEALVRRDAAETAIRDLAEAVGATLGASPAETCVEIAKKAAADLALAKDLARLAQMEAGDRLEEKRTLRSALANLYERCGGTNVPEDDADLIAATADRVDDTIRDASNERAHLLASRVLALRAGIVAALDGAVADPASLDDAALVTLLHDAPSLDDVVVTAVHRLTGEAPPMGRGVAPLAAALGEAVRAVLAERAQADARTALDVAARLGLPPVVPTPAEPAPPARRARTFE